jgi:hypothetical protein
MRNSGFVIKDIKYKKTPRLSLKWRPKDSAGCTSRLRPRKV